MNYEIARSKIHSGDLLAWSGKPGWSWYEIQHHAIRILTESEYVHTAVAWRLAGRVFVLEASKDGVRIYPLSRRLPCYWTKTHAMWSTEVEEFALSHFGDPFSKLHAWQALLGILKRDETIGHPWECAEFAIEVLEKAGVYLNCRATPSLVIRSALALGGTLTMIEE